MQSAKKTEQTLMAYLQLLKKGKTLLGFYLTGTRGHQSLFGLTYIERSECTYDFFDASVMKSGQLTITKLDRTNRIISGAFNVMASKNGCTIISITDGRFDLKF